MAGQCRQSPTRRATGACCWRRMPPVDRYGCASTMAWHRSNCATCWSATSGWPAASRTWNGRCRRPRVPIPRSPPPTIRWSATSRSPSPGPARRNGSCRAANGSRHRRHRRGSFPLPRITSRSSCARQPACRSASSTAPGAAAASRPGWTRPRWAWIRPTRSPPSARRAPTTNARPPRRGAGLPNGQRDAPMTAAGRRRGWTPPRGHRSRCRASGNRRAGRSSMASLGIAPRSTSARQKRRRG